MDKPIGMNMVVDGTVPKVSHMICLLYRMPQKVCPICLDLCQAFFFAVYQVN